MEHNKIQIKKRRMKDQVPWTSIALAIVAVATLAWGIIWGIINVFVKDEYTISLERSIEEEIIDVRGTPHIHITISVKNNGFRKAVIKREGTFLTVSSATVETLNSPDDWNTFESLRILEKHKIHRGEPVPEEYFVPILDDQSLLYCVEMNKDVGKELWYDKKLVKW
jgi:hypothetical protein